MADYRYVEVEDISTWPAELKQAAISNRQLLISYQKERSRIERLGWDDLKVRFNPPENPYKDEYLLLINRLDELLNGYSIVGYHCTRLLLEEIANIKQQGLQILSKDLILSKFKLALSLKYITADQYNTLINSETIQESLNNLHGNRTGMAWFCPNRSTLKDKHGVYRLLRSWGGEAVYNGHEEGIESIPILRLIGIPSIVKCAIPISDAEQYHTSYAARFLSYFISDEIDTPEPPASFDMNTKKDLAANEILEVIQFDHPLFAELTDHQSWHTKYKIYEEAI